MTPVIALRSGKPVLAVASVGASRTEETTRLVAGALQGNVDLGLLVSAPPLLLNLGSFDGDWYLKWRPELIPVGAYDAEFLEGIAAEGLPTEDVDLQRTQSMRGTAVIALIDRSGETVSTVETPTVSAFGESEDQRGVSVPPDTALTLSRPIRLVSGNVALGTRYCLLQKGPDPRPPILSGAGL